MEKYTTLEMILIFLYVTAAIALMITAYLLYLKRFKRNKMEAMNQIRLETSIDNRFSGITQFLIVANKDEKASLELLDEEEKNVDFLLEESDINGHYPIRFDSSKYKAGKYFLYLKTENTKILRKITILNS